MDDGIFGSVLLFFGFKVETDVDSVIVEVDESCAPLVWPFGTP